ncbi:hypothetical protein Tco_1525235 [Tanacetum coccineum]
MRATPPPHPAYRMTARITIPEPLPVPAWSDSEVARLLAISSPPASPLSPWSSSPPQIPFPLSPPSPVLTAPPPSPIRSLGYRAATIRMRAEAAATSHSLPLPPPFILSPTRPDAPPPCPTISSYFISPLYEVGESSAAAAARPAGGLRADYGFVATMDRQIRRDPERYVGYGITDSWDEIVETLQGAPVSTDTELVSHNERRRLGDGNGYATSDLAHGEVMSLRTTVHAQMSKITELQSADRSRRRAISDLLETDRRRVWRLGGVGQVTALQGQVMALQGQVTALQGQQGPAGGPAQPELPEEAGSSS